MFSVKFLKNSPFGICIGFILAFALSSIIDSSFIEKSKGFYTYILTTVVSLGAASLALSGVLANLQLQVTLKNEERLRRLSAARAFLPQALSEMCEVSRHGMMNCYNSRNLHPREMDANFVEDSISNIRLTDEIVSIFRDIVEHSSDNSSIRIQLILREHQVFSARWRSHVRDRENIMPLNSSDIAQRTTSWAYLYALTSTAFDYARGQTANITEHVNEERISSALSSVGIHPVQNPDYFTDAIGLYARHYLRQQNNPR